MTASKSTSSAGGDGSTVARYRPATENGPRRNRRPCDHRAMSVQTAARRRRPRPLPRVACSRCPAGGRRRGRFEHRAGRADRRRQRARGLDLDDRAGGARRRPGGAVVDLRRADPDRRRDRARRDVRARACRAGSRDDRARRSADPGRRPAGHRPRDRPRPRRRGQPRAGEPDHRDHDRPVRRRRDAADPRDRGRRVGRARLLGDDRGDVRDAGRGGPRPERGARRPEGPALGPAVRAPRRGGCRRADDGPAPRRVLRDRDRALSRPAAARPAVRSGRRDRAPRRSGCWRSSSSRCPGGSSSASARRSLHSSSAARSSASWARSAARSRCSRASSRCRS